MKLTVLTCAFFAVLGLLATSVVAEEKIHIDADFPGGNIKLLAIEGDTVLLQQELRDTEGFWFYWSFRIRGAAGRTLHFQFKDNVIGARGAAVSKDAGKTWTWAGKLGASPNKFSYTFGPEEDNLLFSMAMNYTESDWNRFFEPYRNHPNVETGILCKSKKGRNVEYVKINGTNSVADYKVYFSCRSHSCEMMANYVLEGIIETILSDTPAGEWLRNHADFYIVPFIDKDGVEEGDQGKNRKPHDHNRDYIKRIYPEIEAITEQVPLWQGDRPIFVLDLHCPWLRGGDDPTNISKGTNEYAYFVGLEPKHLVEKLKRFGKILENQRKGPIPYQESFNLDYGKSWNRASNVEPEMQQCSSWGGSLPKCIFASSLEMPYANASGVTVDQQSAKAFGKDIAQAVRVYLETEAFSEKEQK